ncbi:MAG: peptidase [Candidatus Eremiobacteraeota bacterium]|nr:peptidase [Candidatus Eremiobacteraeota bacterium]
MKRTTLFAALFLLLLLSPWAMADTAGLQAKKAEKDLLGLPPSLGPLYWSRIEKTAYLKGQFSKLYPVAITYDKTLLSGKDRHVLEHLVEASRYVDRIFLRQVSARNEEIKKILEKSADPLDRLTYKYFLFNFGPFDRLNEFHPFFGNRERPLGANFYPADMTKEELESWLTLHPEDREAFTSDFTVIRRKGKDLAAVPYSQEYADLLEPTARALEEASRITENGTLRDFLAKRARALRTNDYFESDLAWMSIEGSLLDLVIGPYEVYEDKLFNYKASFEAYVFLNLPGEAKKFEQYTSHLRDMEANLPLPGADKNLDKDFSSPIRIVHLIYSAGDARSGIHTAAFALPNDERVRKEKGCKKVMLKNIMEGKFRGSTYPIAQKVIMKEQLPFVTFEAYFRDTVFHELSHGLGPGLIALPDGTRKDTRVCLKENYSSIEECKADALSVYNQLFLMDKGVISRDDFKSLCVSYLAGIFRSVRFGIEESHGRGSLVQLNWMMEKGAFSYDSLTGTYRINFSRFAEANRSLARELLEIQARGDYEGSGQFLRKYGACPSHLMETFSRLYEVPVDIEPLFEYGAS